MQYARIENNILIPNVGLPYNLELIGGGTFFGFNVASLETHTYYGYYPQVDITPSFDSRLTFLGTPTYTVETTRVTLEHTLINYSLTELKANAIATAYTKCETILNQLAEGYSIVEIATFPAMQADILTYVANKTIGSAMQEVISRGRLTADTLVANLLPKITSQQEALLTRDNQVTEIMLLTTCEDVVSYSFDTMRATL